MNKEPVKKRHWMDIIEQIYLTDRNFYDIDIYEELILKLKEELKEALDAE